MKTGRKSSWLVSTFIVGLVLLTALVAAGLALAGGTAPLPAAARSDSRTPAGRPLATNPPVPGTWTLTGSLNTARYQHTATLLGNGKVLVAAGYNYDAGAYLSSAELYDPATGVWTYTGSLNTARSEHTATLLANGQVLVAGGFNIGGYYLSSAELYDPATGLWTATGSLNTGRENHTATLLANGQVLVAGGYSNNAALSSAELYDPATGTWSNTGSLHDARSVHTATLLPSGQVLVAGGQGSYGNYLSSAELYDPATGVWTYTGSLNTARRQHTATLLPNGQVLVAGGINDIYPYTLSSAELYDPATGVWTYTGSLNTGRYLHPATLLANGQVLVAGGTGCCSVLASAELYDPATGTWTYTGSLNTARNQHTATLLANGQVLVAGGQASSYAPLASAELYAGPPPSTLLQISSDPYAGRSGQHNTEVEPDTFSFGSTIVSSFQVGRFFSGGALNVGFATSTDGGQTWTSSFLPGITKVAGGPYDRVSDPSVAYDAAHNVWFISSLGISTSGGQVHGIAVVASRSTDGGLQWSNPVTVTSGGDLDKNWTVCDTTSTSSYYGRCYTQWDDHADSNRIKMSTSTDGGLTWGAALNTADNITGIGGQPLVQANGTVVVPILSQRSLGQVFACGLQAACIRAFTSTDGGATWNSSVKVNNVRSHKVAGSLRTTGPLPSAEIDAAGKVYVVWQDCRFRSGCSSNDIVMSVSTDGATWSRVARIPIDDVTSGADYFIPGLAVDRATSGNSAHLVLSYYYYPTAACTSDSCQLYVGYVSSLDGGATWGVPTQLAGPMTLTWLANTNQGYMVGDYISTSFLSNKAYPVFAVANAPGQLLDEAMYTMTPGLVRTPGQSVRRLGGEKPAPDIDFNSTWIEELLTAR